MTLTGAPTLSALRSVGDRLALRTRFHDSAVYARHRPQATHAARIYEGLELARLDALGVAWLAGVAQNLLAHPGIDDDGPRWAAFEAFSGRRAPGAKAALADGTRGRLPAALADTLVPLAAATGDPAAFAALSAKWATDAAGFIPPPAIRDGHDPFPALRPGHRGRQLPERGDPGGTSAPLRRRTHSDPHEGGGTDSGHPAPSAIGGWRYHVYTTAYDRVVDASSLGSRDELAQLRLKLQAELSAIRPTIARLAKRLMRVLMARQARHWRFDLDEGVVDGSRLGAFVASPGTTRPFKAESDSPFPETVVTLLIDHSGSMRGRPMLIAALTVEIFVRVLERCGVRCEVLGFTTREWDGGEPARQWAANGYPDSPGRLNALEHIVVKNADVPWRRARAALGLFLRDDMLKENIDGEALDWAHSRLMARSERRRILVVVSDGSPMDEATMAANGHEYLEAHLLSVTADIEGRSPVQLAAIGIGHDVSAFYRNATRIAKIDDLGPALTAKLTSLLATRRAV